MKSRTEQNKPKAKKGVKSRIPVFKTIEEEAEFWDTHDLTEFEDEFEEVTEEIRWIISRGGPKKAITVRLDDLTFEDLSSYAHDKGVPVATLARLLIAERLWELKKQQETGKDRAKR